MIVRLKSKNSTEQNKFGPEVGPEIGPLILRPGIRLDQKHVKILANIFMKPNYNDCLIATGLPETTFKRKLKELISEGLVIKFQDKNDKRKTGYNIHPDLVNNQGQISLLLRETGPKFGLLREFSSLGKQSEKDIIIIRSHRLHYRVDYKRLPTHFQEKLKSTTMLKPIYMKNWTKYRETFDIPSRGSDYRAILTFNLHCLEVQFPEIYGFSAEENLAEADRRMFEVIEYVENNFPIKLGDFELYRTVERKLQEHEWIHHYLALLAKKQGKIVKSANFELGSESIKDQVALETTNPKTSAHDMQNVVADYEYMREKKVWVRNVIVKTHDLEDGLIQVSNKINEHSNNIQDLDNAQRKSIENMGDLADKTNSNKSLIEQTISKLDEIHNLITKKSLFARFKNRIGF